MKRFSELAVASVLLCFGSTVWGQKIELASVVSKSVTQMIDLPGEFLPFQSADLHAKVRGFVDRVLVDRGSVVRKGQLLVVLTAPEMKAQISETEAKVQAAESERLQAEAQLSGLQSTYDRMKKASETPGALSGNEIDQAEQQVNAARAAVEAKRLAKAAVEQAVQSQVALESYLRITAPFNANVTERLVHPGALVGPGSDPVLLVIQDVARLRLVVAVPEQNVGAIWKNAKVEFRVPAYPQRIFTGTVARMAHSLDEKTRTMAVELDVFNRDAALSPGMYPSVKWPVRRNQPSLLVPKTSVVTTTERTFVVRESNRRAEWVNVTKGAADGELIEVFGNLQAGDKVVRAATDEIRAGTLLP